MDMKKSTQPVAFLFAGQGNPMIGMGADLWDINTTTRHIWDCASDISGIDLRRCCSKGPMNRLIKTTVQQIAVTAINLSLYSLFREKYENITVAAACGHSVGEYSAWYAAGSITLEQVFRMLHFRANLMDDLSKVHKGSMQVVKGIGYQTLKELIASSAIELDISCDNSPRQQVIGGSASALGYFTSVLIDKGYDTRKLGVSGAWHTRLMAEGVPVMREFLMGIEIKEPQYPVLMNVTGVPSFDPERIRENLSLHLTHRVQWADSIGSLLSQDPPLWLVEVNNKVYFRQMLNDFAHFSPDRLLDCRKLISRNEAMTSVYPSSMKLQQGGKRTDPDELTKVNDSGE